MKAFKGSHKQTLFVDILALFPGGLWGEEIAGKAGYEKKLTLSGIISGLFHTIRKYGFPPEAIIAKHIEGSPPHTKFHYKLTTEALEAWLKVSPRKQEVIVRGNSLDMIESISQKVGTNG